MKQTKQGASTVKARLNWRHGVLVLLVLGSLAWIFSLAPISQDTAYHGFADRRTLVFIPHFYNVISNLPFLLIGLLGVVHCLGQRHWGMLNGWSILFMGLSLVGAGSAYYHWDPSNDSLLWDRLPMTLGFMGLFVALLGEFVSRRLACMLLLPALVLGGFSVLYWHWTDDLRLYYWVQLLPILMIPSVMLLFASQYSHRWLLLAALGSYLLAKLSELYDLGIFQASGEFISGHTLKHLLAAAGCYCILLMLQKRTKRQTPTSNAQD